MLEKLKDALIDKMFEEEDYYDGLKSIVSKFGLEANTCDFDDERIYKKGYEEKEDWEAEEVAYISIQFVPVYNGDGQIDRHLIKIIDVY